MTDCLMDDAPGMTSMMRTIRRIPIAIAAMLIVVGAAAAQEPDRDDRDPDDRLHGQTRLLVEQLTARGMPEAVEALVANQSRAWRIHVARAYAKAADETADAEIRRQFVESARTAYESVIALERQSGWLRGLRRCVDVAQWRVELADLLLRRVAGPDLDRYEVTSGLDFPRERLRGSLEAAGELYDAAGDRLDVLLADMAVRDEAFLLLGLTETVRSLAEQRQLGSAWVSLFLGMIAEPDSPRRPILLADAMGLFDAISRWQPDTDKKYNAQIGTGIALRELGRLNESLAALVRVERSVAPPALTIRASYERVRTLIAMKDYAAARRASDRLAALQDDVNGGGAFYIRLAPLLNDYVDVLEAGDAKTPSPRQEALRKQARAALAGWMARGGPMAEAASAYMSVLGGDDRGLKDLTPAELVLAADTAMGDENYERAVAALQILLRRADSREAAARARYQLGVCYSRLNRFREAAAEFAAVERAEGTPALLEQSHLAHYQSQRAVAALSRSSDDYRRLAKAAAKFAGAHPEHPSAAEARWVAGLALEEVGELEGAIAAFEQMIPGDPRYWEGRFRAAQGRQRRFDSAGDMTKQRFAHEAARSWRQLGQALSEFLAADADRDDDASMKLAEWRRGAWHAAAELYASERLRDFETALEAITEFGAGAELLPLQARCLFGLGRRDDAGFLVDEYLDADDENISSATLAALASEIVDVVNEFAESRSGPETRRVAADAAEMLERIASRLDREGGAPRESDRVRLELVRLWIRTGRHDDARSTMATLVAGDASNGLYILESARLEESISGSAKGEAAADAMRRAESLWARLLEDTALRQGAPATYWEARYYWLAHQLRHGRAREVARGIEAEQAWYPDLGGPPWQGKLIELERSARAQIGE